MKVTQTIAVGTPDGLQCLREASQSGLALCFPGVGSAFARQNDPTCLIVAKDGVTLLVDVGTTIPRVLSSRGIGIGDFDYYHVTHSHADHIGGLEELLLFDHYVINKTPRLILTEPYKELLWERTLRGGCEHRENGTFQFDDLADFIFPNVIAELPREIYEAEVEGIRLVIFRTVHIPTEGDNSGSKFWSTGLLIDGRVLFTADTRFDPLLFEQLPMDNVDVIFHDCQLHEPGTVHATYEQLKTLDNDLRGKMHLTHYGDMFQKFDPATDGFAGFAQPWAIYQ
ncbi:MAG: MBL fold metallo-hydrolase [Verrucomicrobiota bacterium]|jgi:ribonuclease BN (tRNA processing enzyme)|nr:MBL fold metallo-hydrolase [Verrucomicrobiota bacterium]MDP7440958.1 MBL fold metallo-hydrolase [Verrucomicrobiota bacterium]HJN81959.1 MBL fold metallo-hydrolase [Verrucomicrobiota bacterium]